MWPLSLHTGIFGTKNSTTRENERQQSIGIGILRGFQKGSHCFIKSDTIAFHLHFHTEERDREKKKKNTPHFCTFLLSFSFSPPCRLLDFFLVLMEFQSRKKIIDGKIQNCSFKWAVQASHEMAIHEQN